MKQSREIYSYFFFKTEKELKRKKLVRLTVSRGGVCARKCNSAKNVFNMEILQVKKKEFLSVVIQNTQWRRYGCY